MATQQYEKNSTEIDQESKATNSLSAHSARFFNCKTTESQTENEKQIVPLGLKFAEKTKLNPRNCPTYHSSATQSPTPRGDSSGDVGMDVDF